MRGLWENNKQRKGESEVVHEGSVGSQWPQDISQEGLLHSFETSFGYQEKGNRKVENVLQE